MKNDPIIHAKTSKIVEAIMKDFKSKEWFQSVNPELVDDPLFRFEVMVEFSIRTTLASFGGEESFSLDDMRRVVKYALYIDGLGRDYPNLHSKKTQDEIISEALQTAIDIKSDECYKPPHPSEREVLSGEQFYEKFREVRNELSAVTGTYSLSEAIIKTYDRYLAEKHKTEQLYCHHNGKYTLKEDGTCCKCHLPLVEKGGEG